MTLHPLPAEARCWTRPQLDHGRCPSSTECTATELLHTTTVVPHAWVYEWHVPQCSCGWEGPAQDSVLRALGRADVHLAECRERGL